MRATKNDWIIRGVKGELYPCKPDIFELTYEPWLGNPNYRSQHFIGVNGNCNMGIQAAIDLILGASQ